MDLPSGDQGTRDLPVNHRHVDEADDDSDSVPLNIFVSPRVSTSSTKDMVEALRDPSVCLEFGKYLEHKLCDENLSFHVEVSLLSERSRRNSSL